MTKPRSQQISLEDTPFYHCYSRCVRSMRLCGFDELNNRSYEYRRLQIEKDMLRLASVFYIDIAAYAIMSNHYHTLLHVRREDAIDDCPESIVQRAHQIISGNDVSQRFLEKKHIEPWELEQLNTFVDTWRSRLHSISWFMKFLNEGIARRANKEDDCAGHFWESRYKSQALLDEQAVLSCMAYIDLNPIRAGLAKTPEQSDYTSIKQRIAHWKAEANGRNANTNDNESFQPKTLMLFVGSHRQETPRGLAFNLVDYLHLLDWTGRAIRDDQCGKIHEHTPPILQRLNISPDNWLELSTNFERRFKGLVGSIQIVKKVRHHFGLKRHPNYANSKLLFG